MGGRRRRKKPQSGARAPQRPTDHQNRPRRGGPDSRPFAIGVAERHPTIHKAEPTPPENLREAVLRAPLSFSVTSVVAV